MKVREKQERGLERVSHLFLSGSKPAVEKQTVTIQVAARTLGVSKGTIITYLNKGVLTRIKKDGAIYIEMDEVKQLSESKKELSLASSAHTSSKPARGTAGLMTRDQPKQPSKRLEQFAKERQGQPGAAKKGKHKELERLKSELDNLRQNLAAQSSELAETKTKLRKLEKEQVKGLVNLDQATETNDHQREDTRARPYAVEQELKRLKHPSWKELFSNPSLRPERPEKKKMVLITILSLLGVLIFSVWWSNRSPTQPPSPETEGQVYESGTVQSNSQAALDSKLQRKQSAREVRETSAQVNVAVTAKKEEPAKLNDQSPQLYIPGVETSNSAGKEAFPRLEENQQISGLASTPAVYVLRAETLAKTWLHLIIDDSQELEYLLDSDEQHTWRAKTGFKLRVGNAAGLRLYLNDQPLKALGERGEVVLLQLPDPSLMAISNSEYTDTGGSP